MSRDDTTDSDRPKARMSNFDAKYVAGLLFAAGGIVFSHYQMQADVKRIEATVQAHAASPGHTGTETQIELLKSRLSAIEDGRRELVTELRDIQITQRRIERRLDAVCASTGARCKLDEP